MKNLVFAFTISSLLSLAVIAQTPNPPNRPTTTNQPRTASAPNSGNCPEVKVAILYSSQFWQGIDELKVRLDALEVELEPKKKEIEAMEADLKKLNNQIQTQSSTITPQVRKQWAQDATDKERLIKRKAEDFETLSQKRLAEVSEPVSEKIRKFTENYCQQRGIVMVLEGGAAFQAGVLFWATQAADITNDFMKEYNKANPAAAAPKKN
ncbi:MAG: OmpH family outer membrane protein [Acidobacteria bacterium]|nr:OmpH family outer membrane protein [Acidobacteriota bacterium]